MMVPRRLPVPEGKASALKSGACRRAPRDRAFGQFVVALKLCLVLSLLGCGRSQASRESVQHMLSYSLLEYLGEAEVEDSAANVVEPRIITVGGTERPAIAAFAPCEIRFSSIPLYSDARLDFGVGINDADFGERSDGVRFAVRLEGVGLTADEVWSGDVRPQQPWLDVEVDLGAFAGRVVDLVLVTEPRRNRAYDFSAWSLPVLRSSGGKIRLDEAPMDREAGSRALELSSTVQTVQVPDRARLEVLGEIVPKSAAGQKARGMEEFAVQVNGEPIFSRAVQSHGRAKSFFEAVSLADYGGQTVELSLEAGGADSETGDFLSRWLRATLIELEEMPRRLRDEGPNLLLVVVDTLRADHLSLHGYGRMTSPNLDRFAQQALVFERAISQSSWTMPAVASLLTGLYPPEHAVRDEQHLESHFRTLADIVQTAGVTTFAISSNPIIGNKEGFHQGFEKFIHLPWARAEHVNAVFYAFLEEKQDLRWFAYLHYIDPHDPYDAPEPFGSSFTRGRTSRFSDIREFASLWEAVNFGRGEVVFDTSDLEYLRAAYDGEILYWDSEFGRLLEYMKKLDLLDDTVIIVTSDHGEEFLEHGKLKHGIQLYEESIWVPLVIRAPGRLNPERRAAQVETLSVNHAALALMGLGSADVGLLSAGTGGRERPAFSHTTHALLPGQLGRQTMASIRDARWKYISYVTAEGLELYDLQADPGEQANSASQEASISMRYQQMLDRWLAESKPLVADGSEPSYETLEELRDLGYIQ